MSLEAETIVAIRMAVDDGRGSDSVPPDPVENGFDVPRCGGDGVGAEKEGERRGPML
jgi:hypothetical protein